MSGAPQRGGGKSVLLFVIVMFLKTRISKPGVNDLTVSDCGCYFIFFYFEIGLLYIKKNFTF